MSGCGYAKKAPKNTQNRKPCIVWGQPSQKDKVLFRYNPASQRPIRISCCVLKPTCIPPSVIDGGTYLSSGSYVIDGQTPNTQSFSCVIDGGELM
jgi:hypothetical protein